MPKGDAFAGIKLSDQVGMEQRLFSTPGPQPQSVKPKPEDQSKEVGKEGSREVGKEDSFPATRPQAPLFDINAKPYRKDSFLFTDEEFEGLEDLKLELRRTYDLKATKNDIARCALQQLLEDYRRHGGASVLVRRLQKKNR